MSKKDAREHLGFQPRGLSRDEASAYIGVGTSKFDQLVKEGSMPSPKVIGSRRIWDRFSLDRAFSDLPDSNSSNDWDEALGL